MPLEVCGHSNWKAALMVSLKKTKQNKQTSKNFHKHTSSNALSTANSMLVVIEYSEYKK